MHLILFEGIYMHNLLHLKKHILLSMRLKRKFSPLNVQNVKLLRHGFASIVFGNTETNVWAKFSLLIILHYWLTFYEFCQSKIINLKRYKNLSDTRAFKIWILIEFSYL